MSGAPRSGEKAHPVFCKYGGTHQLRITSAEDLRTVSDLSEGRWMATSCPVPSLRMDRDFLAILDPDSSGRILSGEIKKAIRWLFKILDPSPSWTAGEPRIALSGFRDEDPEAASLKKLAAETAEDPQTVSLEAVRRRIGGLTAGTGGSEGLISPDAIEDDETSRFAEELLRAYGELGGRGLGESHIRRFHADAEALMQWHRRAEEDPRLLPFGADTSRIFGLFAAVRNKIDQYFALCDLLAYGLSETAFLKRSLDDVDLTGTAPILEFLEGAPLSTPAARGELHFDRIINSLYVERIESLRRALLDPPDQAILSKTEWIAIKDRLRPYESWQETRPETPLAALDRHRIEAYLSASHTERIQKMISEKGIRQEILGRLRMLERLLLLHQWLFLFVNNFASFPYLFRADSRAIFEMGTLVLDARELSFSIRVQEREAHANLAKNSGIFLLYVQLSGPTDADRFEIAVPVTSGNARGFTVERRGVFFTWDGRQLDGRIVKIVENPISLWESMKQPFKRLASMITSRLTQMTATLQKEAEAGITNPGLASSQLPASPAHTSRDTMIGAGFLVAGLGTAVKFLVDAAKQLTQPDTLKVLLSMIGIFLLVTLAVNMVTAARRLRRRDLSALLQASGWAMNGKMRLIPSMARLFTRKAVFPPGSRRHRREWREKKSRAG